MASDFITDPHALLTPNPEVKYIHKTTRLTRDPVDHFWRSDDGTIFAFSELQPGDDPRPVCGNGIFSLGDKDTRNDSCAAHDFEYSCPVYQAFHTRKEADDALKLRLQIAGYPVSAELFYELVRVFGRYFWENPKTNV